MHWEDVLQEVLTRKARARQKLPKKKIVRKRSAVVRKNHPERKYYLGEPYTAVYFTPREAETITLLLRGGTIASVADTMHLSARTIEYYIKNMKQKLHCRTRPELIEKVADNAFMTTWFEVLKKL